MRCPRRDDMASSFGMPVGTDDTGDTWTGGYCSYCGSMFPDEFLSAAVSGVELTPTDKNYKVYVNDSRHKFYFQHLSAEQRQEFVTLLNAGKLHLGHPGRFYVLPFFVQRP